MSTTVPGPANAAATAPRQSPPEQVKAPEALAKAAVKESVGDGGRRQLRRALEDSRKFIERNALKGARPLGTPERAAATAQSTPAADRPDADGPSRSSPAKPVRPISRFEPIASTAQAAAEVYKAQPDAREQDAPGKGPGAFRPVTATTRVPPLSPARGGAPVSPLMSGLFFPKGE